MKDTLSFKVDPRIKKAILELAEKENRSLSNYVVTLLIGHLDEHGIDWRRESVKEEKFEK